MEVRSAHLERLPEQNVQLGISGRGPGRLLRGRRLGGNDLDRLLFISFASRVSGLVISGNGIGNIGGRFGLCPVGQRDDAAYQVSLGQEALSIVLFSEGAFEGRSFFCRKLCFWSAGARSAGSARIWGELSCWFTMILVPVDDRIMGFLLGFQEKFLGGLNPLNQFVDLSRLPLFISMPAGRFSTQKARRRNDE